VHIATQRAVTLDDNIKIILRADITALANSKLLNYFVKQLCRPSKAIAAAEPGGQPVFIFQPATAIQTCNRKVCPSRSAPAAEWEFCNFHGPRRYAGVVVNGGKNIESASLRADCHRRRN
jgi:hypothetical protein